MVSRFGKMPRTSVRRRISLFRRSFIRLVEPDLAVEAAGVAGWLFRRFLTVALLALRPAQIGPFRGGADGTLPPTMARQIEPYLRGVVCFGDDGR